MLIHVENGVIFLRLHYPWWIFTWVNKLTILRNLICVETVEMCNVFVAMLRNFLGTLTLRAIRSSHSSEAFFVLLRPQLWTWDVAEASVNRHCKLVVVSIVVSKWLISSVSHINWWVLWVILVLVYLSLIWNFLNWVKGVASILSFGKNVATKNRNILPLINMMLLNLKLNILSLCVVPLIRLWFSINFKLFFRDLILILTQTQLSNFLQLSLLIFVKILLFHNDMPVLFILFEEIFPAEIFFLIDLAISLHFL